MKSPRILRPGWRGKTVLLAALAGVLFLPQFFTASAQGEETPNTPAPAWQLKTLDGKPFGSDQLKGKVAVIDFWATWCGPCRQEIPGYVELQKKYGADGLVIVGVSLDRIPPARVKKFVEKEGMNYTVVMGDDAVVDLFGGFNVIPTTFLIDREGRIVHKKSGVWSHDDYEALVKKHL